VNICIGTLIFTFYCTFQKLKRTAIITKTKGFIELLHLVELHLYGERANGFGLVKYLQEKLSVVRRNSAGGIE
jgi:hypothetical protein